MSEQVRELTTKLGYKVDEAGAKKYEDTFSKLVGFAGKAAVALGIMELGKHLITAAAGAETMRVDFEAFTGSAAKASSLMEQISKYAMKTGMSKDVLDESAKKMLAMGIGSEKVMGNLNIIGNLSAGLGKDKIPMLTEAMVRMNDRGIVNARSFMMLQAAGVPIMDALRKQTGMTTQQLMEMGNKGALKYADMEKALLSLTTGNGKFANLAMKQATTLNGLWDRGKIILNEYAEKMGTALLPAIEKVGNAILNNLMNNLDKATSQVTIFVDSLLYWFGYLRGKLEKSGLIGAFEKFGPVLKRLFADIVKDVILFGKAFADTFSSLFKGTDFLGDLGKLQTFLTNIEEVVGKLTPLFTAMGAAVSLSIVAPIRLAVTAIENLLDILNFLFGVVKNPADFGKLLGTLEKSIGSSWSTTGTALLNTAKSTGGKIAGAVVQTGQNFAYKTNPPTGSGNSTRTVNIKADTSIIVPPGTQAQQADWLKEHVTKLTREQMLEAYREISANTQRIDYAGVNP